MAKKKKGTLKDMVKAPRTIDINGQLHMLAWITPKEGNTLKELGGAGKKGPMGIPAFYERGRDPSSMGGDVGRGDVGSGQNDGAVGNDQDDRDPFGPGQRASDSYSKDRDFSISGVQDTPTFGGLTERQRESFGKTRLGQRAKELEESGQMITGYKVNPSTGDVAGFMHTSPFSSGLASIYGAITGQENVLGQVYSGDPSFDPFSRERVEGGGDSREPIQSPMTAPPIDVSEEDTPLTEALKKYYAQGIGTATRPTSDFTSLISSTTEASPSPIGGRYDPKTGLFYLPDGTAIDIRTGKKVEPKANPLKIRGLEMFKPASV